MDIDETARRKRELKTRFDNEKAKDERAFALSPDEEINI